MALEDTTFVSNIPYEQITGVVLAGGRARRMGGQDKGLIEVAGKPMVTWVVEALRRQCGDVVINANRNSEQYASLTGCTVISDAEGSGIEAYAGPLAGVLTAMRNVDTPMVLTTPCDCPLVTGVLCERLYDALVKEDAEIAVVHDGTRMHPVFMLTDVSLAPSVEQFLESGERKIDLWFARHRLAVADFSDHVECFANVNEPEDLDAMAAQLEAATGGTV